ncbi:uncharacterized protein EKO05_0001943 [Ascochyta rabiei]|uniref:Uncharacterized protein n=1 Tax=Didymella rabiei TaxID=5454 RepID=A0A163I5Y3_DIDRA|nr:uncharacterized protein EKO05_0001943 [Ascochyta rabiei]KZM25622.1 hypothetical protein ST47_g3324 [Ascochyta rabiei]UPX11335.1 hypothetical protein EKO05_0001943 [Ascochyta rabiei]
MRPTTILTVSAITASAVASTTYPNVHAVVDLNARAMDPATMDPTKLSVLSVLKTVMPTATGTDVVLPTGGATPQWYKDLPADVMVLLVQMYPVAQVAAVSGTSSIAANASSSLAQETLAASQTTRTRSLELVSTATGNATSLSTGSSNNVAANGTLPTGAPSPSKSTFSTGAKNTVRLESWSFVLALGVTACFFALA